MLCSSEKSKKRKKSKSKSSPATKKKRKKNDGKAKKISKRMLSFSTQSVKSECLDAEKEYPAPIPEQRLASMSQVFGRTIKLFWSVAETDSNSGNSTKDDKLDNTKSVSCFYHG